MCVEAFLSLTHLKCQFLPLLLLVILFFISSQPLFVNFFSAADDDDEHFVTSFHTAFTNTNSICRCRFTNTTHTFTSDPSTLSLFRKEQNNQTNSKLLSTAVYGSTAFKSKQTNKQNGNLLNHSSKKVEINRQFRAQSRESVNR